MINFFLRDITKVTWAYESPVVVHTNAIPFSNVAYLARNSGVKAVLTGEGADEMFMGYPRLLTSRFDKIINVPYPDYEGRKKILDYYLVNFIKFSRLKY